MSFRPFVEISHRAWTIQQTWNEKTTQFDRVAVKGGRRVDQGNMTYSAFLRLLDGIDGIKPGSQASVAPAPVAAPVPEPRAAESTPAAPSHPSLFGDSL